MQRLPDKNTRRGREGRGGSDPRVQGTGFGRGTYPTYQHVYFFGGEGWALYARVVPLGAPEKSVMRGRGELPKARSILIMDNLHAQTTDEFNEYLAKHCNTLAWYGPSECTDGVQPVHTEAGRFLKVEVGRQMDIWLEQSDNLERWETASLTASDRRVLITQWMGAAMARLNSQQAYRYGLFETCGMAMTVDGSGDDRITLEGLDKPYTFANDEDSSDDEQGLENGNDEPEGRAEEGDGGRETLMEGVDSSDEDDGGKFVLHKTNSSSCFC